MTTKTQVFFALKNLEKRICLANPEKGQSLVAAKRVVSERHEGPAAHLHSVNKHPRAGRKPEPSDNHAVILYRAPISERTEVIRKIINISGVFRPAAGSSKDVASNPQSHSGSRHFLKRSVQAAGVRAHLDFWGECDGPTAELSSGRILTPLPGSLLSSSLFSTSRLPASLPG